MFYRQNETATVDMTKQGFFTSLPNPSNQQIMVIFHVVGKIMASKDVLILIPGASECAALNDKGDFADVRVKNLEIGR